MKGTRICDLVNGEAYCGASAGLIKEIISEALGIKRLALGYREVLRKLTFDAPA